jgi:dTDP-4-dehydrorhamnose reductase
MRVLVTGAAGQLGSDLVELLGERARPYDHRSLDVCDEDAIARAFAASRPDAVVNCAAYNNVDLAEREAKRAFAINAHAVRLLARRGVPLVHISTNYVFDGRRDEPYGEQDLPAPRSVYAASKLAGEHMALAYGTRPLVVRTAALYGIAGNASKGGNFAERILARARSGEPLRVVADQLVQPTYTPDLAAAILAAVRAGAEGIVHLTASGACSWYEFARAIVGHAGLDVPVEPTATAVGGEGAERPRNGLLARPRADALGLSPLRPWRDALADYMRSAGLAAALVE